MDKENRIYVQRKFNLSRINRSYESVDIGVYAESIEEAIQKIEEAWRYYCKMIVEEKVQ